MRIGGLLLLHTFGKKRLKVASVALKPVRVPVSSPCLASGWDLRKFTDRLRVYAIACGLVIVALMQHEPSASAQQPDRFAGPTSSQPLALTADGESLLAVNPDDNSV